MFTVAALYHFAPLPDPAGLRPALLDLCAGEQIKGTLILAPEGVNGTVAGPRAGIDRLIDRLRAIPGFADLDWKESQADTPPFHRLKLRIKPEIVTMNRPGTDPRAAVGTHVDPADWNALISAPDVVVIDTRNRYETAIGTFAGAIDPSTDSFSDFPDWWQANRDAFAGKRIAMFCTGGIRCEKSTSYLVGDGMPEVFHLRGGILKYLEQIPADQSLWQGECFVFDERVAVGHGLAPGTHSLCRSCRMPLSPDDRARPEFEDGVTCHHCAPRRSADDRARLRERHRQVTIAAERGARHIGGAP